MALLYRRRTKTNKTIHLHNGKQNNVSFAIYHRIFHMLLANKLFQSDQNNCIFFLRHSFLLVSYLFIVFLLLWDVFFPNPVSNTKLWNCCKPSTTLAGLSHKINMVFFFILLKTHRLLFLTRLLFYISIETSCTFFTLQTE